MTVVLILATIFAVVMLVTLIGMHREDVRVSREFRDKAQEARDFIDRNRPR